MRVLRVILLATVLSMLIAPAAQAAPIGSLKQHRIPTDDSAPLAIAVGSDGNLWFTESSENLPAQIGRITPAGAVTEFPVECNFCILTDIVQGPDNVLYYTSNEDELGRITTDGTSLAPVQMPDTDVLAGSLAAHGDDVWITDFNNHSIWRYDIPTGLFTQYVPPTPFAAPSDVAVDAAGTVWFTEQGTRQVGRIDPATGVITEIPTPNAPRDITVATDGQLWYTTRFTPQAVSRLNPATNEVTVFPVASGGPEGIAASPDGSVWFTLSTKGNIARVTNDGVITETKAVKGSDPFGITVDAEGDPWYTMMAANKIAEFQLR
jgi:streptogramin lyase